MKQCPRCRQTYTDDQLNFCLEDGELLTAISHEPPPMRYADDAPSTIVLDDVRVTNPANWPVSPSPAPIAQWSAANAPLPQFGQYAIPLTPNQTLGIVSLGLGIGSLTVGWCCSVGLLLSPAALITGFVALSQIKKDPAKYGGRGFAIGGVITGIVFLAAYLLIMLIYGIAMIGNGLSGYN